jgi:predicted nicotinamide N-methyase
MIYFVALLFSFITSAFGFQVGRSTCCSATQHNAGRSMPSSSLSYKILGGIPDENEEELADDKHKEFLRHLDMTLELDQRTHENDGSVSQAGTAWEASRVLADFITNPKSNIDWRDKTVMELGSGLGTCSLAAAFMGAKVIATDASATSLALLRTNAERYSNRCEHPVVVAPLLWGDHATVSEFQDIRIDMIIASDVVFFRSNRDSLKRTIEELSGPSTMVLLAHTWRTDPDNDEKFFRSFDGFDCEQVEGHMLPQEYNRRGSDGRLLVSIFQYRRRQ